MCTSTPCLAHLLLARTTPFSSGMSKPTSQPWFVWCTPLGSTRYSGPLCSATHFSAIASASSAFTTTSGTALRPSAEHARVLPTPRSAPAMAVATPRVVLLPARPARMHRRRSPGRRRARRARGVKRLSAKAITASHRWRVRPVRERDELTDRVGVEPSHGGGQRPDQRTRSLRLLLGLPFDRPWLRAAWRDTRSGWHGPCFDHSGQRLSRISPPSTPAALVDKSGADARARRETLIGGHDLTESGRPDPLDLPHRRPTIPGRAATGR